MNTILQNLRSVTPGVEPTILAPAQLCFNLADEIMFVGDGSSTYTQFNGDQLPAPSGGGWFSLPLSLEEFSNYFLLNPADYSPAPTDNQILAFSSAVGKPVWADASDFGSAQVYVTTNADVAAAPGVTVSDKISSAIGGTPVEADSAIVSGVPGDVYQGLYLFNSGVWTFAAGYADPTAIQVPYNNVVSGLVATTVQAAIDELVQSKLNVASNAPFNGALLSWNGGDPQWIGASSFYPTAAEVSFDPSGTGLPSFADTVQEALTLTWLLGNNAQTDATQALSDATAAQTTANAALTNSQSALNSANDALTFALDALTVANTALPKAGGTMTGDIVFNDGQPVDAGLF
jgi:hypothetical protein